ncbi:PREDICTED: uncharacterized protein LOC103800132, partial [Acanthisitta chloris]|uniref:uncharacterized protein LOC103800132 n=1 Tax=Acanthisitta chloris TaxID=57068 RepID=UPI0004F0CD2F
FAVPNRDGQQIQAAHPRAPLPRAAPAAAPRGQCPLRAVFAEPPHHSPGRCGAIPLSPPPPSQKKRLTCYKELRQQQREQRRVQQQYLVLWITVATNCLFPALPFIHKGSHGQQRQTLTVNMPPSSLFLGVYLQLHILGRILPDTSGTTCKHRSHLTAAATDTAGSQPAAAAAPGCTAAPRRVCPETKSPPAPVPSCVSSHP